MELKDAAIIIGFGFNFLTIWATRLGVGAPQWFGDATLWLAIGLIVFGTLALLARGVKVRVRWAGYPVLVLPLAEAARLVLHKTEGSSAHYHATKIFGGRSGEAEAYFREMLALQADKIGVYGTPEHSVRFRRLQANQVSVSVARQPSHADLAVNVLGLWKLIRHLNSHMADVPEEA